MRLLDTGPVRDPAIHLAVEEWCVRNLDPEDGIVFPYVNDPCVVVGKNQNVYEEVDLGQARRHGVPIVRRLSGGGTVYHDPGNLNVCFFRRYRPGTKLDFAALLEPLAVAVRRVGAPVARNARNDLLLDDRKVSGNAQFTTVRTMFSHATLLFDARLDVLRDLLRVDPTGFRSNAPKSVRSSVTNIRPRLPGTMTIETFSQRLVDALTGPATRRERVELGNDAWSEIERLANDRYRSWEWTFGRAPRFSVERRLGADSHAPTVRLDIERGSIVAARLRMDGDGRRTGHLVSRLPGRRYRRDDLVEILREAGVRPETDGVDAETMAAWLHP